MNLNEKLNKLNSNPKRLFLIDAVGALVSAFFHGVVLVKLEKLVGIPVPALYFSALFPVVFSIYDFLCYLKLKKSIKFFLKIIAYANILYCFVSIGVTSYYFNEVTYLGWVYILVEIFIILVLVTIELKVIKRLR